MACLCYVQPLNNGIFTAYEYILRIPLSVTPIRILSVNTKTSKFRTNSMYCKIFIYIQKNLLAPQVQGLLEKLAESFLYNFHRKQILIKLKIKKLLQKNSSNKKCHSHVTNAPKGIGLAQDTFEES